MPVKQDLARSFVRVELGIKTSGALDTLAPKFIPHVNAALEVLANPPFDHMEKAAQVSGLPPEVVQRAYSAVVESLRNERFY